MTDAYEFLNTSASYISDGYNSSYEHYLIRFCSIPCPTTIVVASKEQSQATCIINQPLLSSYPVNYRQIDQIEQLINLLTNSYIWMTTIFPCRVSATQRISVGSTPCQGGKTLATHTRQHVYMLQQADSQRIPLDSLHFRKQGMSYGLTYEDGCAMLLNQAGRTLCGWMGFPAQLTTNTSRDVSTQLIRTFVASLVLDASPQRCNPGVSRLKRLPIVSFDVPCGNGVYPPSPVLSGHPGDGKVAC